MSMSMSKEENRPRRTSKCSGYIQ